jgi:hypothetical protein
MLPEVLSAVRHPDSEAGLSFRRPCIATYRSRVDKVESITEFTKWLPLRLLVKKAALSIALGSLYKSGTLCIVY